MRKLGKKIKLAMVEKNLTQLELAKKLGVKQAAISKLVRGINNLTLKNLKKISKITNKPLSYFLEDPDSDTIVNTGDNSVVGKNQSVVNKEPTNNIELLKKEIENLKLKIDLILEKSKK